MSKLIKDWKDLEGLESETHKIELDYDMDNEPYCGWIRAKVKSDKHDYYLSTHTFYGHQYQESTRVLQERGFDVEIDNWDKDNPIWNDREQQYEIPDYQPPIKLTTNQRKIKEFKEKANRPDASDNDVKKLIRACGGDVDKAVALILDK